MSRVLEIPRSNSSGGLEDDSFLRQRLLKNERHNSEILLQGRLRVAGPDIYFCFPVSCIAAFTVCALKS